jgi:hypothetical protein
LVQEHRNWRRRQRRREGRGAPVVEDGTGTSVWGSSGSGGRSVENQSGGWWSSMYTAAIVCYLLDVLNFAIQSDVGSHTADFRLLAKNCSY